MNIKKTFLFLVFTASVLSVTAQFTGTNPVYTNSLVGIGFATQPSLNDQLTVNGSFRIFNAGRIYPNGVSLTGYVGELIIASNDQGEGSVGATSLTLRAGSAIRKPGGNILIDAGEGEDSQGGTIELKSGNGNVAGDIILNSESNNGFVGIGIANPQVKLHVLGVTKFDGNVGIGAIAAPDINERLVVDGNIKINHAGLIGYRSSSDAGGFMIIQGQGVSGISTNDMENAAHLEILAGSAEAVTGTKGFGGNLILNAGSSNNLGAGGTVYIDGGKGSPSGNIFMQAWGGTNKGAVGIGVREITNDIKFQVGGNSFFEKPVGIGLAVVPPSYNLAVTGGILTERVKVASVKSALWKDMVFDEHYNLLSLNQLEQYIKANKHLPEVPSALEVEKDGYEMVNMDATLLQKIEELTLYIIQMKAEMEELKKACK